MSCFLLPFETHSACSCTVGDARTREIVCLIRINFTSQIQTPILPNQLQFSSSKNELRMLFLKQSVVVFSWLNKHQTI